MKIGWVTPFNDRSAIGVSSCTVVKELRRRGMEVHILPAETGPFAKLPLRKSDNPIRSLKDIDPLASDYDLLVVTFGDHYGYNGGSFEAILSRPCVGIFHDADLTNFFYSAAEAGRIRLDTIEQLRSGGWRIEKGAPLMGSDLAWLSALCVGAVAHADPYKKLLDEACSGPTLLTPLCFPDQGVSRRDRNDDSFTIVTFGHLNPNKQMDRVLNAVAQSKMLAGRVRYRLIGAVERQEHDGLVALASQLGVAPPEFEGSVDDETLYRILGQANVICCLRYPICEGGSASLAVSLYSGTPVIVADAGAYSLVPDKLVTKVPYGTDVASLTQALERVASYQVEADGFALQARDWACRTFSASNYADRLIPFLQECLVAAPMVDAGRTLGRTVASIGIPLEDPAVPRIGSVLNQLFGLPPNSSHAG